MNTTRRSLIASVLAAAFAVTITVGTALAAELMGTIKSVDVDAKKMVVTEKDTDKDIDVMVNEKTEFINKKGETSKYDIARAKKGQVVEITHEDGVASKIVAKKGAAKKEKGEKKEEPKVIGAAR